MSGVLIPAGLLLQSDAALSSIKRSAGAESPLWLKSNRVWHLDNWRLSAFSMDLLR